MYSLRSMSVCYNVYLYLYIQERLEGLHTFYDEHVFCESGVAMERLHTL